jgi:hypothetical protein
MESVGSRGEGGTRPSAQVKMVAEVFKIKLLLCKIGIKNWKKVS